MTYEFATDLLYRTQTEVLFLQHAINQEDKRRKILLRRFSPVTGYEPDPKREEWQSLRSCWQCPFYIKKWKGDFPYHDCLNRPSLARFDRTPLGDPLFCRFSEYRRILFRKFERAT